MLKWLQGCGYSAIDAENELNAMIKYHTTGADAVSYDYAIDCMYSDVLES